MKFDADIFLKFRRCCFLHIFSTQYTKQHNMFWFRWTQNNVCISSYQAQSLFFSFAAAMLVYVCRRISMTLLHSCIINLHHFSFCFCIFFVYILQTIRHICVNFFEVVKHCTWMTAGDDENLQGETVSWVDTTSSLQSASGLCLLDFTLLRFSFLALCLRLTLVWHVHTVLTCWDWMHSDCVDSHCQKRDGLCMRLWSNPVSYICYVLFFIYLKAEYVQRQKRKKMQQASVGIGEKKIL